MKYGKAARALQVVARAAYMLMADQNRIYHLQPQPSNQVGRRRGHHLQYVRGAMVSVLDDPGTGDGRDGTLSSLDVAGGGLPVSHDCPGSGGAGGGRPETVMLPTACREVSGS